MRLAEEEQRRAALIASYGRQSGPGIAVGLLGGGVGGLATGLGNGSSSPLLVMVDYGAIGAVIAATATGAAMLSLLVAVEVRPMRAWVRLAAVAVTAGVIAAVGAFWALSVFRSPPPWTAVLVAATTAASAVLLGLRAEARAVRVGAPEPRDASAGLAAIWPLLGGGGAVLAGAFTVFLVREQLHIQCGVGAPGGKGDGAWMCADGIGYLWFAVHFGGIGMITAVAGALIGGLVRHARVASGSLVALAALAGADVVFGTWDASARLVWSTPPGVASTGYWVGAVLAAALVCAASVIVSAVALVTPAKPAAILLWIAAGGLGVATLLQPGLGITILPAAGCLVAAGIRRSARP